MRFVAVLRVGLGLSGGCTAYTDEVEDNSPRMAVGVLRRRRPITTGPPICAMIAIYGLRYCLSSRFTKIHKIRPQRTIPWFKGDGKVRGQGEPSNHRSSVRVDERDHCDDDLVGGKGYAYTISYYECPLSTGRTAITC